MKKEVLACQLLSERYPYEGYGGMIGIAKHEFGVVNEFFTEEAVDLLREANLVISRNQKDGKYDVRITSCGRELIDKYGSLTNMLKKQRKQRKIKHFQKVSKMFIDGIKWLAENIKYWWPIIIAFFI